MSRPPLHSVDSHSDFREELEPGVKLALAGIDQPWPSLGPKGDAWEAWIRANWPSANVAIHETYQAVQERRLEDVLEISKTLQDSWSLTPEMERRAQFLTNAIIESVDGARHQKLMDRYAAQVDSGKCVPSPLVAITLKASLYNLSLLGAKLTWLFMEWRGSREPSLPSSFAEFSAEDAYLQLLCTPAQVSSSVFTLPQDEHHG